MGHFLRGIAKLLFFLVGIYGLIVEVYILYGMFGLVGALGGLLLAPAVVALIHIYLFFQGYWFPAFVIYGGGIACAVLDGIGKSMTGEKE